MGDPRSRDVKIREYVSIRRQYCNDGNEEWPNEDSPVQVHFLHNIAKKTIR